jgi:hypothetical protein
MPTPVRAVLEWGKGRWLTPDRSRRAWVLPTEAGLLAPADMFSLPEKDAADAELEIGGAAVELTASRVWQTDQLALVEKKIGDRAWPKDKMRRPLAPEDVLLVADPAAASSPLSASRLLPTGEVWTVDPAVSLEESWHGAAVLSREDGFLLGLLLVTDARAAVAILPQPNK